MRLVFASSNLEWGGSEILWHQSACLAAMNGHEVTVFTGFQLPQDRLLELAASGAMQWHWSGPTFFSRLGHRLKRPQPWQLEIESSCIKPLARHQPDLVVLSQGCNYDGVPLAEAFLQHGLSYAILAEQAGERYWQRDDYGARMRRAYEGAKHGWFVSRHNHQLTEWQIGTKVAHASVVRNPYQVPANPEVNWPAAQPDWRLACVARLTVSDKGQDLLIRLFAEKKWRERPIRVSLFGHGRNARSLKEMATMLGVTQVDFRGQTNDIAALWKDHHALVLPSREEGLPLALVEAMMCNRLGIVTDVAGNSEVVDDGATGFIAEAPTVRHLDEALERAWLARDQWQAMGSEAGRRIRQLVPADPAAVFLEDVLRVAARGVG